jgi:hypothetical protein
VKLEAADADGRISGMAVAAKAGRFGRLHLDLRDDGDPVHAFLAGEVDVFVAGGLKRLPGELVVEALDLLEAKHVRLLALEKGDHSIDAEADGIDIPGRQVKAGHEA